MIVLKTIQNLMELFCLLTGAVLFYLNCFLFCIYIGVTPIDFPDSLAIYGVILFVIYRGVHFTPRKV